MASKAKIDIKIVNHGSVLAFHPVSPQGKQWLETKCDSEPWQWFGGSLCVDHRIAPGLAQAAESDGMRIV